MDELVPLLVMTLFFGIFITMIVASAVRKVREREIRHRERMRALELGKDLPADVDETQGKKSARRDESIGLHGTIWTGIGAGLLVSRILVDTMSGVPVELLEVLTFLTIWAVPALFVGIGLLFYARTLRGRNGNGSAH